MTTEGRGTERPFARTPATAKVLATGGLVALTILATWLLSDVLLLLVSAVLVAMKLATTPEASDSSR